MGDTPPAIHTPDRVRVGGDLSKIDTRDPPDDMHKVDFADALGKKPIVLVFATPLLCQSRVCGPVVDIAEEVKSELGDKVDFIHMEIYNNNEVAKGFRPQVAAFQLPTRALGLRDQQAGQDRGADRGSLQRGRAARGCEEGPAGLISQA